MKNNINLMIFFCCFLSFLCVSRVLCQDQESNPSIMHLVKEGDTLAKIAYKYYSDGKKYAVIADANKIKNPHIIITGSLIMIPNLSLGLSPVPTVENSSTPVSTVQIINVSTEPFIWRNEVNNAFPANEKLVFDVSWKFVSIGYATLEVRGIDDVGQRFAYHLYNETRSNSFFDKFYKTRNTYESWMDVESLCSLRYVENAYEHNEMKVKTVIYDQVNHRYKVAENGEEGEIWPWVNDAFSSLFYIRTKDIEVGNEYSLNSHSGDKCYPLVVKVLRKEKKSVPAGEFECFVVEPHVKEGAGLFKSKGRLFIWLTADQKKIPVMMKSEIAIGSITVRLKSME